MFLFAVKNLGPVRNHVKLEIRSFVLNFNSREFSLRVPDCVVDAGYGLGRSLGIADLSCTKWLKHKLSHVR